MKRPDPAASPQERKVEKPSSSKAVLVGVYGRHVSRAMAEDHIDELEFRSRSLARRIDGHCGSPDASYGGRRFGGLGGGEKLPASRVH